jgi:Tol biopolymer transport system component
MTAGRWRRVEALYNEMRARPRDERTSALAAACADDPTLAAEVLSLLDQPDSAAPFLNSPALEVAARLASGAGSSLTGRRIGAFEVQGLLGVGGMGEVYRARDTRLRRSVAIKILPRAVKDDPERLVRFEREARVLASLSHPHICALYDVGREQDTNYLVMELVEGETLAARLKKGALPLEQTLRVAIEIADALDKAHRQGVIHRDLKPGNVMLTKSGSKLMDFGLAKLTLAGKDAEGISALPTASEPLTGEGIMMGTVPYMAPEQLEGGTPDARSDLWALGCVLYEMATGRPAFEGKSRASLISSIMGASPAPIGQIQPLTPPSLERLVRVCLAKDPDDRLQTAHDVMQELKWIAEAPAGTSGATASGLGFLSPGRRRWGLGLGGLALLASLAMSALLGGRLLAPAPTRPEVVRSFLGVAPAEELNSGRAETSNALGTPGGSRTSFAWTPDGRTLVFVGRRDKVQRLYVRPLDAVEARPLEGTEGAQVPAVSLDGRAVAFWAHGAILRVPLEGGPGMVLVKDYGEVPPFGMAWGEDGRLFYRRFGRGGGAIWSVEADRPPTQVTRKVDGELFHAHPYILPGQRALLYTARRRNFSWGDEEVLAHVFATGERKVLLEDAADARYVGSGHLLFLRRGTLFAVRFDLSRLEVLGVPVPVLESVVQALATWEAANQTGAGQFSVASTGTLAWLPGSVPTYPEANIVAVDRRGHVHTLSEPRRTFSGVTLSPDGRRLAVSIGGLAEWGLWTFDLERGTLTKLRGGGETDAFVWMPDGQRVLYSWRENGVRQLVRQRADGMGAPEVQDASLRGTPSSWSPGGLQLAVVRNYDIYIATPGAGTSPVVMKPFIETPDREHSPEFSPDGKWLAYTSDASGRNEVYVQPYPGPGPRVQISLEGGMSPSWSRAGRELFFLQGPGPDGRSHMMAVEVRPGGPTLGFGTPRRLFAFSETSVGFTCDPVRCYGVSPDGQFFYAVQSLAAPPPDSVTRINLATNWVEEMKARVAAGQAR